VDRRFEDDQPGHRHPGVPANHPSVYTRRQPRVLVEAADGGEAFSRLRLLETAGYQASWCPGPERRPQRRCPLLGGTDCPLIDKADVVVCALGLDHESTREVLQAMHRVYPGKAVVLETTASSADEWAPLVAGHRVVRAPATPAALTAAVAEALAGLNAIQHPSALD